MLIESCVDISFSLTTPWPYMSLDSWVQGVSVHVVCSVCVIVLLLTRSSALPVIQRGIYCHLLGRKKGQPYQINSIKKVHHSL